MVPQSRLSIGMQAALLESFFPNSRITIVGNSTLIWKGIITPTPLSESYSIKLKYMLTERPRIFVVEPKLTFAPGATKLKHVYSTKHQELCLYYPPAGEWHSGMYLATTIVPWASEWLYYHEIWVGTGIWHGGGIEHDVIFDKVFAV